VIAKDPQQLPRKAEKYEGAFVKDPSVGMHYAVACFDFASLYPSIMRQMNVSPESLIKKVDPSKRDVERAPDRIVAVNGAVYSNKTSILKEILSDLYAQRREYKKRSFELQQQVYELEKKIKG
jgi:DNA polymerase elongation subunit (family B)